MCICGDILSELPCGDPILFLALVRSDHPYSRRSGHRCSFYFDWAGEAIETSCAPILLEPFWPSLIGVDLERGVASAMLALLGESFYYQAEPLGGWPDGPKAF